MSARMSGFAYLEFIFTFRDECPDPDIFISVFGSKMSGFVCKKNGHLECPHVCPKVHTLFFGLLKSILSGFYSKVKINNHEQTNGGAG